ncbi:MAG TPA: DUF4386 family protein [Candidatus Eisenbacteria bacterium]|nr:DUF4386 family protein [Candidatus Eisenbacteria bacterium]
MAPTGVMGSPRAVARIAGACYLLSVVAAVLGEAVLHGAPEYAAGNLAIALFAVVTLGLFALLRPVHAALALLAALVNLGGLTLELLRLQPGGVNVALVLHGGYCLLVGALAFRASFLPRAAGVLMAIAGFAWIVNLSPALTARLAPGNVALGFAGEGSFMLWLLVRAVDETRWRARAAKARG